MNDTPRTNDPQAASTRAANWLVRRMMGIPDNRALFIVTQGDLDRANAAQEGKPKS